MTREANSARLFFALVPEPGLLREVDALRRDLRLEGRPVPMERLHATLVFLGSQPLSRIGELCNLAQEIPLPALRLVLNRAGSFDRARVAWIGADRVPQELTDFRARLADGLVARRFSFDRKRWDFHITVYRDLRTPGANMPVEPLYWQLREYVLMQSVQDRAGLSYRVIGRWPAVYVGERPQTA